MTPKKNLEKDCCCDKNLELKDKQESIVALGAANSMSFQDGGDAFLEQIEAVTAIQSNCSCCCGNKDDDSDSDCSK